MRVSLATKSDVLVMSYVRGFRWRKMHKLCVRATEVNSKGSLFEPVLMSGAME